MTICNIFSNRRSWLFYEYLFMLPFNIKCLASLYCFDTSQRYYFIYRFLFSINSGMSALLTVTSLGCINVLRYHVNLVSSFQTLQITITIIKITPKSMLLLLFRVITVHTYDMLSLTMLTIMRKNTSYCHCLLGLRKW